MCEWYCLCVESKKNWYEWTYVQNRVRLTDFRNKLMVNSFFFLGKALLWPLPEQMGSEEKLQVPCSLTEGHWACSLYGARVGVYPGGSAGRLPLGGLPSPPCRGHAQYPAFAPNSLFLLPTPCFPSRVFRSSSRFLFLFCLFVSWFFLHSVGLDKPIMTCLRHYSIIQKIVTAQTILCAPSILPDPWPLLIFLLSS